MTNPSSSDRRARVAQMRAQQKKKDRSRRLLIVGVCVVVGALVIGAAAFNPIKDWWSMRAYAGKSVEEIGAATSSCGDITTKKATGNQEHVPTGTDMSYPEAPPAFGKHWENWAGIERKFYAEEDRPELGMLVHNLEHGYTILWYDETAADDSKMMEEIEAISNTFDDDSNYRNKFKAVPWTSDDGKPFPDGQHIAFSHWSVGGSGVDPAAGKQVGAWQYCSEPSGEALGSFMEKYPYTDSPEPNAI